MILAYVDDSGSHDSPSYTLSAFYTTSKHWKKILREWLGIVHRYKVNAFHATDCANGAGEFRGWSKRRKAKMFKNLIDILSGHSSLDGCSASIVLRDYEEVVYPEAHEMFGGPRVLAFQLLALEVVKRAKQPVAFILDKPPKGCTRSVAPNVAGSIPVSHPNFLSILFYSSESFALFSGSPLHE
jgi:hypothetical protein